MDDVETYRLAAGKRDRQFAVLLTMVVGLAAEEYPDELRAALAKVFDVDGLERRHAELQRKVAVMDQTAILLEERIRRLDDRLQKAEQRYEVADCAKSVNDERPKGMLGNRGKK